DHIILFFIKSAFTNTQLSVSITCENEKDLSFNTDWTLARLDCANIYVNDSSAGLFTDNNYIGPIRDKFIDSSTHNCIKSQHFFLHQTSNAKFIKVEEDLPEKKSLNTTETSDTRKKRDAEKATSTSTKESNQADLHQKIDHDSPELVKARNDGYYLFVIKFIPVNHSTVFSEDFKLKVHITFSDGDNYIAAVDWPLLYFYGIMGLVYIFYGILWLVLLACNWRDLLRVQFWIGGVILLGMLEKAVFFAEFENINKTGQSVKGAIIFAELVSCLKRTLARMLVIIVSLGYGIVKPRLGQTFHKILIVGVLFFILASIEGCMRVLAEKTDQSKQLMLPGVPLATTRTLRLRRNIVKLSLYRHFTNTLIFAILASVAYMIWSMTQHKFKNCLKDWKQLWVDDAFWHLLFSAILFVIMILWRPTANNQRYAFSPLLDAAEDELEDDHVLSEAYDGMKMRTKTQQKNGGPNATDANEDDLKWVEENIPHSFADKLLPVLDSDEEIMNAKFEVSKME
ncbi:Transmembrane protein 87A, partial [Bulinus truncatus]